MEEQKEVKERYYYLRDEHSRPLVTVCLMKIGEEIARGISLCSLLDFPNKKKGRIKAHGMAMSAMMRKENKYEIVRCDAEDVLSEVDEGGELGSFKATYNPDLTLFEKEIVASMNQYTCKCDK